MCNRFGYLLKAVISEIFIGIAIGVLLTVPIAMWAAVSWGRRLRSAERRARSAERSAEIGTLTRGLAHEIKNPLSTLGLNMQLLQEDLADLYKQLPDNADQQARDNINRRFKSLQRETDRLRDILEDFLRFAGRMELELAPVSLQTAIEELTDFYDPQATAAGIRLRTQFDPNVPQVNLDVGLFKQAMLNLMLNATQAMEESRRKKTPNGGANELIIRTELYRHMGGEEVRIHVTDTGPGIAEADLPRIFQPYFSRRRGGTGLGLATTRRIIEEHRGQLAVHSEIGRGSDFTISLPLGKPDPHKPD